MLVNESSFDFALCVICYSSIVLDLSYVLLWDLLAFYSTLVLCFFLFVFASRYYLWPLLLFRFSFCKFGVSSLALVFAFCLAFVSYFCFSFMALIWLLLLLFVFHFLFSTLVRFSFLTSIFHFSLMGESTLQRTKIEGCGVHN
jgi:hypothetical protein